MKSFKHFLKEQSFPDHWNQNEIEQYKWELSHPKPKPGHDSEGNYIPHFDPKNPGKYQWPDGTLQDEAPPTPLIEVPPGSGNWESSNEHNPPGGTIYFGHQFIYNINTGGWEEIAWNPVTNQWEFLEPSVTPLDVLQDIDPDATDDDLPDGMFDGMEGFIYTFINGQWYQVFPNPNLVDGDTSSYDINEWGDCAGPAGSCIATNHDGDWFIWDGENWVPYVPGVDYTGANDIPQDVIDAILNDPGNMDEILDDYLRTLSL